MDDLISRQAAIDALEEQLDYLDMLNKDENPTAGSKWYGVNWARNTIADLPSAQPERKKGEWIETEFLKLRECSCCHVRWGMCDVENFNFCPNCGADMREVTT